MDSGLQVPNQPIYLNEQLTPHTVAVSNKTRELLKSKRLAYVWTSDCKILVKQTEKAPTRKVQRGYSSLTHRNNLLQAVLTHPSKASYP